MDKEKLQGIIHRTTTDRVFREQFIKNPKQILAEQGFEISPDKKIVILENTDDLFHVVLSSHTSNQNVVSSNQSFSFRVDKETIFMDGRLDSNSVSQVRETMLNWGSNMTIDLKGLKYISSAGLSLFLGTRKHLDKTGLKMILVNLKPEVRNVFILAGFDKIFNL
jgi:anti-anti-sigma factor